MSTRRRPRFRVEDYRVKSTWGCAPVLFVLLAVMLAGCVSRSVVRLNETTPEGSFRIVYRNIGDARSTQTVDYSGADWRLRVGAEADITSPAHEAAAAQLTALAGALAESLGKIPW